MTSDTLRVVRSKSLGWATAFAAGTYAAVIGITRGWNLGFGWRLALATIAVVAFIYFVVAEVRLIRCLDELQRKIQLEALSVAYPVAIIAIVALGLFQWIGLLPASIAYVHIWPALLLTYWFAWILARRRYR